MNIFFRTSGRFPVWCLIISYSKILSHRYINGGPIELSFFGVKSLVRNNMILYLFTRNRLLPGGSGYFTCKQNMKLVSTKFKSGGLHEKHVVATWNLGNHLSICLWAQGNQEKPVSRWPVARPSEY